MQNNFQGWKIKIKLFDIRMTSHLSIDGKPSVNVNHKNNSQTGKGKSNRNASRGEEGVSPEEKETPCIFQSILQDVLNQSTSPVK